MNQLIEKCSNSQVSENCKGCMFLVLPEESRPCKTCKIKEVAEGEDFNIDKELQYIDVYTRAEAISDEVLIDVSVTAQEAGFKVPVAVTKALWVEYITPHSTAAAGQSIEGRLWDMLWMAAQSAKRESSDTCYFNVIFIMKYNETRNIRLKSIIGPGDNREPVITIMLPHED